MVEIDARKLECPKPVLLTKAETDKGTEELRVQVDNEVAVGNLARPIFAYFRKVVLPTVTENIHGFFDVV